MSIGMSTPIRGNKELREKDENCLPFYLKKTLTVCYSGNEPSGKYNPHSVFSQISQDPVYMKKIFGKGARVIGNENKNILITDATFFPNQLPIKYPHDDEMKHDGVEFNFHLNQVSGQILHNFKVRNIMNENTGVNIQYIEIRILPDYTNDINNIDLITNLDGSVYNGDANDLLFLIPNNEIKEWLEMSICEYRTRYQFGRGMMRKIFKVL